jgi:hypothetical protein
MARTPKDVQREALYKRFYTDCVSRLAEDADRCIFPSSHVMTPYTNVYKV